MTAHKPNSWSQKMGHYCAESRLKPGLCQTTCSTCIPSLNVLFTVHFVQYKQVLRGHAIPEGTIAADAQVIVKRDDSLLIVRTCTNVHMCVYSTNRIFEMSSLCNTQTSVHKLGLYILHGFCHLLAPSTLGSDFQQMFIIIPSIKFSWTYTDKKYIFQ